MQHIDGLRVHDGNLAPHEVWSSVSVEKMMVNIH